MVRVGGVVTEEEKVYVRALYDSGVLFTDRHLERGHDDLGRGRSVEGNFLPIIHGQAPAEVGSCAPGGEPPPGGEEPPPGGEEPPPGGEEPPPGP